MAYTPRLTAPSFSDKRWIVVASGGYNQCIDVGGGSAIPNCTGYVHGRWMEIGNTNTDYASTYGLCLGNASEYYNHSDSLKKGTEPALGAIICFSGGGGAGHVAVVEQIISNDEIVCSESDYDGARFSVRHRYRQLGWKAYSGGSLYFDGFIYHPDIQGSGPTPEEPVYTLSISGGTASVTSGKKGDSVSIEWVSMSGYQFTGWTISGAGTIANASSVKTTFTFGEGNATVTAHYAQIRHLNIQHGTASKTTGIAGDRVTIKATLPTGCYFKYWQSTSGTIANRYAISTMFTFSDSDSVITAILGYIESSIYIPYTFVHHRNKY